jgi:hypothetical protein
MTSRPGIRPSRLGLFARLATTMAVGAGATVGAVLVHSTPAAGLGQVAEARPSNLALATAAAQRLLTGFAAPPGANRLAGEPSELAASTSSTVSAAEPVPYQVVETSWWRSDQSADGLVDWLDQHPERGLFPSGTDPQTASAPRTVAFSGRASEAALNSVSLTVTAYALGTDSTILRVVAAVGYVPPRPTSEVLPPAAMLIVVPTFPLGSKESAPEVTLTDAAEIARIEQVVNALPKAPAGRISCPFDNGAGMALDFEDAQNTTLADVVIGVHGCERVQVSINGYNEPALSGGQQAAAQIQAILGTHWDLTQLVDG